MVCPALLTSLGGVVWQKAKTRYRDQYTCQSRGGYTTFSFVTGSHSLELLAVRLYVPTVLQFRYLTEILAIQRSRTSGESQVSGVVSVAYDIIR